MELLTSERTREILDTASRSEIAILGDVMLDRYFWGTVSRVSPEAPVPVVDVDDESYHLGGAANVAANIHALGAAAVLFGVVGSDEAGERLRSLAVEEGLDPSGLVVAEGRPTTVKTRVIGNNQQLLRLDHETRSDVGNGVIDSVVAELNRRQNLKAIVIEDYDKGFLSEEMIAGVVRTARERSIPVFVDPKKVSLSAYRNCYLFKPNRKEAADALGKPLDNNDDIRDAGRLLLEQLQCEYVLITLGSEGMMLFEKDGTISSVPTLAKKVADVSGAGDTAIATLAAAMAGGGTVREAATLSNIAAGVVVGEPGIVAITREDLLAAVHEDELHISERQ